MINGLNNLKRNSMEKIPTAEEFMNLYHGSTNKHALIEFAKLHVEAALKEASEKAIWDKETRETWFGDTNIDDCDFESTDGDGVPYELHKVVINKASILNSYSLDNIK